MLSKSDIDFLQILYGCETIQVYKECLSSGRLCTSIKMDGVLRGRQTSAWLVEIKYGRKLEKFETVDHIDNDKRNDSLDNLQILSRGDNARKGYYSGNTHVSIEKFIKRVRGGEMPPHIGEKNGKAKLTNDQVRDIRNGYNSGALQKKDIISLYSISRKAVENVLYGITYTTAPGIISKRHVQKLSTEQYEYVISELNKGTTFVDISKHMNINRSTLRDRINVYIKSEQIV